MCFIVTDFIFYAFADEFELGPWGAWLPTFRTHYAFAEMTERPDGLVETPPPWAASMKRKKKVCQHMQRTFAESNATFGNRHRSYHHGCKELSANR